MIQESAPAAKTEPPRKEGPPSPVKNDDPELKPPSIPVSLLRFEDDSWFKVCFWITRDGQSSDSSFIGCNKGPRLLGEIKKVELPQQAAGKSASACSMIGIKAEVYLNTENCVSETSCLDESYAKVPSYTRTTSMPAGPGLTPAMHPFLLRVGGDGAPLDGRVVLTPEMRKAEDEWAAAYGSGPVAQAPRVVRIIFEDQTDASMQRGLEPGANLLALGLDFNDVLFDLELPADPATYGFEGTGLQCKGAAQ